MEIKELNEWEKLNGRRIGASYKSSIKRFISQSQFDILEASYGDILTYIEELRRKDISIRNLQNQLCAIKFYYDCLQELGKVSHHPCRGLYLKDKVDKRIDVVSLYSEEELVLLANRSFSYSNDVMKLRNKLLVSLLIHQGLKTSELVSLQIGDLDLEEAVLNVRNKRKLNLESVQILPFYKYLKEAREQLTAGKETQILLLSKSGKELDSSTISSIINYKEKVKFIPRKVRQSVIYHLLKSGISLIKVQQFAGHRYISSTEVYQSGDLSDLQNAIEKYHPL